MHYKSDDVLLLDSLFAVWLTSRQYHGDPIDCIVDEIPLGVDGTPTVWIIPHLPVPERLTGITGRVLCSGRRISREGPKIEVKYHKY
ncbi:Innexin inx2 [Lucilia cuprina]|nr:Innexin inx2 [Lucilia cuprina]